MDMEIPKKLLPFAEPAEFKAGHGGRGGGKTRTFGQLALSNAFKKPKRILCCREIHKSIKGSVKTVLDNEARKYKGFFKPYETEIMGANGSRFMFAGLRSNPESIQSLEDIDIVWVVEAQAVSQQSLDILMPTVRKLGSELWFEWNPRSPDDPVDAMFRKFPPPNSIVIEVNYEDNPWFWDTRLPSQMEYDRSRDPDRFNHIWRGKYLIHSSARVFHNWKVEEFESPKDANFLYGGDWGFSVDPSVLIRCFKVDRTLYVDREAWAIGCPIDKTPDLFDTIENKHARNYQIRTDSARPDSINYMKRHGYPRMIAAKKGPNSIEEGIEFLKNYDIVIHPDCRHVIDEFTFYSWKTIPGTDVVLPVLKDKKNNTIDSLRYATEPLRGTNYRDALAGAIN